MFLDVLLFSVALLILWVLQLLMFFSFLCEYCFACLLDYCCSCCDDDGDEEEDDDDLEDVVVTAASHVVLNVGVDAVLIVTFILLLALL